MTKYRGPCIDCGQYKNKQFILKRCLACYGKFHRSQNFKPRKKYLGPCVNCGSFESNSNLFSRKMCSRCYSRFRETGDPNLKEKKKYSGPCIVCGAIEPGYMKYFAKEMCGKCYRHYHHEKNKPMPQAICIDCGEIIPNGKKKRAKKKRCQNCHEKWKRKTDPDWKTREKIRNDRYRKSDKGKENDRHHLRHRRAILLNVENTLTQKEWKIVLENYNHKCFYCGSNKKIEQDHIIPVSKGGPHIKENVVPACRKCNASKRDEIIFVPFNLKEFYQQNNYQA